MISNETFEIKGTELEPLQEAIGKSAEIYKVGAKSPKGIRMFPAQYTDRGVLTVVDRGGGPSVFLQDFGRWFITSWVLKAEKTPEGIEIETENSLYLIKYHEPVSN